MTSYPNDPSPQTGQSYGQQYGQPQQQPAPYGQQQYPAAQYDSAGQSAPQPYGQQPSPYGQQPPAYGQQPSAYGQYGAPTGTPAKPGGVVTAAVFGIIYGVLGALVAISLFYAGAVAGGAAGDADSAIPGLGSAFGALAGAALFIGFLALAWTVVMIWGSAWALTGRSRVLLLVGGSIAIATTAIVFLGSLGSVDESGPGGVIIGLVFLIISILIVVLLSTKPAADFFAAHRARRQR